MKSLRAKLIISIALPALCVYVVILGGMVVYLRGQAFAELGKTMTRLAINYAGRFDGYLREAAAVADMSANAISRLRNPQEEDVFAVLRAGFEGRPFIYGACAAFEPGVMRGKDELYAPYVYRRAGELMEMNISREVYDWYSDPKWTWFREPKSLGRPVWSAPYFDEGAGNVLMTTYSSPFSNAGEFRGVTTVDIDLTRLRETIGANITEGYEFVILAPDGRFVYDDLPDRIMSRTIVEVARQSGNHDLEKIVPTILGGTSGEAVAMGWDSTDRQWLFYAPIQSTDWTLLVYTPETLALTGVRQRMLIAIGSLAGALLLIITCIVLVSGRITRPLTALTEKAGEIAAGNLEARVAGIVSQDEIARLGYAFNTMTERLREHVERLAAEEAARQKVEGDLAIAREIQQSLLPEHVPPLRGFELAGWSQPADETGGDYYDWQPLPDGRAVISLADVTGHGIGPALVTAVCRAYARASFPGEPDVGRVFDRINALLCEDLKAQRFVTFAVALVSPSTETVHLLSAGHGPLFYLEAAKKKVHEFPAHDIPMGLSEDIEHGPPTVLKMAPGDMLALITDGFFEWANPNGEQYGATRVAEVLMNWRHLSPAQIIEKLVKDVLKFAEGSTQLDDLTAVILKRVAD